MERKWTAETIKEGIENTMRFYGITTMPTKTMIREHTGNYSLLNAIDRSGGVIVWANRMGIEHKGRETTYGDYYEERCAGMLRNKGYVVERMRWGYPYDILVNGNVKVDVKAGKLFKLGFYTFNLEKKNPTCDIFVAYCVNKDETVAKTLIIPSAVLTGKTQLSVGKQSVYDNYKDRWDYIEKYAEFFAKVRGEGFRE